MAETTSHETEMSRDEMAAYLHELASELEGSSGSVRVPIGNKDVRLSPGEPIDSEAKVVERSRLLRKDSEALELSFEWYPSEGEGASERDSGDAGEEVER